MSTEPSSATEPSRQKKAKRSSTKNPKTILTRVTENAPLPDTYSTPDDLKRAWKAKLGKNNASKLDYLPIPSDCYVDIKDPVFATRIGEFLSVFTRSDIDQIALHTPKAFVGPFKETYRIIQYITTRMGLTPPHIVQAGAFDFSLEHIIKRHHFAERCGVYQMVTLRNPEIADLNPSLAKMLRTNDVKFARLVGVSLEEYEVFCELFELERNKFMDFESADDVEEVFDASDDPDFEPDKSELFMLK